MSEREDARAGEFDVAVIGMSGRFPGADDVDEFWRNLRDGVEGITRFTDDELRAAGVPDEHLAHPDYVRAAGRLRDVQHFDAGFFGYSPREAEVLEPAHRLFLECAWEALETAGYAPETVRGRVGVYAGAGAPHYVERHVRGNAALMAEVGGFQANLASSKDFIATRTAYKLNLRGPALTVQTACSTSLVAVHLAVQSLLSGESDLALAGGATVLVPQESGYLYSHGGISSPDGYCRAFDADSAGTLSGSGVGVVVLKRLQDALEDGDQVHAVIRGSAINNDGSAKVAFTAPGVDGQSSAIAEALSAADVDPSTVTYVETHGTGTDLGDTIEVAALTRAFGDGDDRSGWCALGSVKTSVGHLDTAAGVTGLIKTVLAMEHGQIPPTLHFKAPNPKIPFAGSPFFVADRLMDWPASDEHPRRAGVSSFGIGGTNAHVVLEEAPEQAPSGPSKPWQLLVLSARTARALDAATARLARHLADREELPLADVAFTLREGRRAFAHRRAVAVREGEDAVALLSSPERAVTGMADSGTRSVVFLFPGVGDHYPEMARGLYESEPVFRAEVDRCAEILTPHLGMDLREALFPGDAPDDSAPKGIDLKAMLGRASSADPAADRLNRTELAQPAVFVIEYALAKLWESWGVVPEAVIGHSLGEYVAACVAGVMSVEDALPFVADRARMIQGLPGGSMLAVPLDEAGVRPFLADDVSVATVNAPGLTVVSGPEEGIARMEAVLAEAGHVARRIATTHAFHSRMMAPIARAVADRAGKMALRPPRIPLVSNVTGTWMTDGEAVDPTYWSRHLTDTVRFAEGIGEILREPGRVLVEVGPGQTLSTFVRQRGARDGEAAPAAVIPSLRYAYDRRPDAQVILDALGRVWIAGVAVDWTALRGSERRRRVALPTYPWDRQRYWVEAPAWGAGTAPAVAERVRPTDPRAWIHVPTWIRTPAPVAPPHGQDHVLLFSDGKGFPQRMGAVLTRAGYNVQEIRPGAGFSGGKRLHLLRPDARADYHELAELLAALQMQPRAIVHALSLSDPRMALPSLALFAEAVAALGVPTQLIVLTDSAQEVTGGDARNPAGAALVGAAAAIGREYPHLTCRVLDVAASDSSADSAARAATEVVTGAADSLVALRGRHRWIRQFHPAAAPAPAATVRPGGTYVFVGQHAGIDLAAALGATAEVNVVRIDADGDVAADVADADALAAAIAEVEGRYGSIHGVFCAPAGAMTGGWAALAEADSGWSDALDGVAAEVEALVAALGERQPDFVLADTTLLGTIGGAGRVRAAAGETLAEALALRAGWTPVAWDHAAGVMGPGTEDVGLAPSEIRPALDAVLAMAGEGQLLVSTLPLEGRIRDTQAADQAPRAEAALYDRPEMETEYHAPTNEVEEKLAEVWQGLLGIRRIGVHDDFFGMGGHSLLATQIVARVRDLFQLELPLQSIFEAPTIARYAELIESAIIAELEALSDEEAAALMA